MTGYERDYVTLPAVSVGDMVRVGYTSGQTDTEQERHGEVIAVHVNGFEFAHESGGEGDATAVREHEDNIRGRETFRRVSTVTLRGGRYVHAAGLNRGHSHPDDVPVTVEE